MAIKTAPEIDQPAPLQTAPQRSGGWFRQLQRRVKQAFAGDDEHLQIINQTALPWRIYRDYQWLGIIEANEQRTFQLSKHGLLNVRPATGEENVEYLTLSLTIRVNRVRIYRQRLGKEVELYAMRIA